MSDQFAARWGIRGRIWAVFFQTLAMGLLLCGFTSVTKDNGGMGAAMGWLASWATLTSMTCGGIFAVVPFIEPSCVGGVSGIVGAGGNAGALFGMAIMSVGYRPGFLCVGIGSLCTAIILPLLWMAGVGSMFRAYEAKAEEPEKQSEVQLGVPQPVFVSIAPGGQVMPYQYPATMHHSTQPYTR